MKNECGKYHYPSFSKTCCLRHLLEMSHYAQKLTLTKKYSKLLLTTLNHVYKEKAFNFAEMKLDLLLLLLDVISKFMGHFYMVQKYEYSKLLGIIATKALKETDYKQHPEIIIRECAINNNISCLYEAKEKYSQAYKYICYNKKYIEYNNDFDNAVFYNNLIRICLKNKNVNEVKLYVDNFRKCLDNAITLLNNIRIKKAFENGRGTKMNGVNMNNEYSTKNELIALMMFNFGNVLDKINNKQEAKNIYVQGYEFSISTLGEWNFYTQKLKRKIMIINNAKEINDDVKCNLASKNSLAQSSSEDETFTLKSSKSMSITQTLKNSRSNTLESKPGNGKQFLEDSSLIDKINRICEFVEKFGDKLPLLDDKKNDSLKNRKLSQSTTDQSSSTKIQRKQKRQFSYETFKQMCKPFFLKFFQNGQLITHSGSLLTSNNLQSKSKRTALIAEVLEEYGKEQQNEKKAHKQTSVSCPKTKLDTPPINFNPIASPPQAKKPPKIKELFSKVINLNKPKEQPQGIFAQLASELMGTTYEMKQDQFKMKPNKGVVSNNVVFDNSIINNESSISQSPRVVLPIPNSIAQTQSEGGTDSSTKNYLKPELEEITKGINFNIEYENNDEVYEFKPFYRKNNAYTKTIQSFATQKKVCFIKNQNQNNNLTSVLGSLLFSPKLEVPKNPYKPKQESHQNKSKTIPKENKVNKIDEDLISITEINSKTYEFEPFYNSSVDFTQKTTQHKEVQQKSTKFAKNSNTSFVAGLDDFQITTCDGQKNPLNITKNLEEAETQLHPIKNNLFTGTSNTNIKNFEEILSTLSNSCIDFEEEFDFEENFEFYNNRSKNVLDIYTYFDQILSNSNKSLGKITNYIITLPFQNETFHIVIKNESNQKRIQFSLYKNESQISLNSPLNVLSVEYTKLNKIIEKLHLYKSLPLYYDINNIQTIDDLMKNVLAYHAIIINKENRLTIGLSAKPNGINGDKQITFRFLKSQCSIDIIVFPNYIIRIIVSMQITFSFDCYLDKSSFNIIAKEIQIENSTLANTKEYTSLFAYKFNEDQISKNGLIPIIMKKIQEILKMKYSNNEIEGYDNLDESNHSHKSDIPKNIKGKLNGNNKENDSHEITLVKVYKSLHEIMFKCEIKNSGKDIAIWFLNFRPKKNTFCLEIYDKNETNLKPISSVVNVPIYPIFDCISENESKLMFERISEREQTIFKFIIMNNYYNNKKEIKEIKQENLYSFTFLPEENEAAVILNFNVNKYIENICYIGRLVVYDNVTMRTSTIMFLPKNQIKENIENDVNILKKCDKSKIKNTLYNLYIEYIKDIPHRTIDTQDLKPLKKFLPLSYVLNLCK